MHTEICTLMGHCAAYGDNTLPTLRDNPSVPKHWYYHHKLRNILEDAGLIYIAADTWNQTYRLKGQEICKVEK